MGDEKKTPAELLAAIIDTWAQTELDQWVRPECHPADFQGIADQLESILSCARILKSVGLSGVPPRFIASGLKAARLIEDPLQNMRSFNPSAGSAAPNERRNQIVQRFNGKLEEFWRSFEPLLTFAIAWRQFNALAAPRAELDELIGQAATLTTSSTQLNENLTALVSAARTEVGQLGVTRYIGIFRKEGDRYRRAATRWLVATIFVALCLAGFAAYNLHQLNEPTASGSETPTTEVAQSGAAIISTPAPVIASELVDVPASSWRPWQQLAAKVFNFTLLVTATLWCGRLFKAARHNETLNRHRHTALTSYRTFVRAADNDEQTKNALLLHVAQAIFAHQPTGYIAGEPDQSPQVLEFIRYLSPKA